MPTYEYHCPACDATYDLRQGFDAETTHKCEECGKGIAKRVLHAPPVVFKGSGWYVTDSKGKSSARTDTNSHADSADGSSSSGDSKPSEPAAATKADAKPSSSTTSSDAAAS